MPGDSKNLVHSVAFRVTEAQWVILQRYAEDNGKTIPQLTKEALFEKVGLESTTEVRRRYGQTKRDSSTVKLD